jgi:hypothetical protein
MDISEWIASAVVLAICGVPFGVGIFVSSWPKAMLLAFASFAGIYASIWSTLGPLFLPLAPELITRFELSALLGLSFLIGALQAVLIASLGFAAKKLLPASLRPATKRASAAAANGFTRPGPKAIG